MGRGEPDEKGEGTEQPSVEEGKKMWPQKRVLSVMTAVGDGGWGRSTPGDHWRVLRSPSFTWMPSLLPKTAKGASGVPLWGVMAGQLRAKEKTFWRGFSSAWDALELPQGQLKCAESVSGVRMSNGPQEVRKNRSRKTGF